MTEPKRWPDAEARTVAVTELIETLEKWDGKVPTFAALVTAAVEISTALGYGDLLSTELVHEFELLPRAPKRWANGVARPMSRLAAMVAASIARRLRHQLDDVNRIERKL